MTRIFTMSTQIQKGYNLWVLPQFCWMAFQQHKIEHIEFFF